MHTIDLRNKKISQESIDKELVRLNFADVEQERKIIISKDQEEDMRKCVHYVSDAKIIYDIPVEVK